MEPVWFAVVVSVLFMLCSLVALYVWNNWQSRGSTSEYEGSYDPVDLVFTTPVTENDKMKIEEGKRVMLNGEIMDTHNGIYVKTKGKLTRARDLSSNRQVRSGAYVFLKDSDEVYTLATFNSTKHKPYQGISIGILFISLREQVFGTTKKPASSILSVDDKGALTWIEKRQKIIPVKVKRGEISVLDIPLPLGISTISVTNMSDLFWIARCVREGRPILSVDSKSTTGGQSWIAANLKDDSVTFTFQSPTRELDLKVFIA